MAVSTIETMIDRARNTIIRAYASVQAFAHAERGASLVEYALLIALIAMAAFIATAAVGNALETRYDSIATSVTNA